ncbi:hypothetical protein IEQ34_010885 [Dendrobium chrysotoxum]|uniref:Alpha/beta hydrolase fold-3 domain-containing protein n=1 Tax=Dendrobium chrysotoxum TaxID=161865 RepID=A0AAV7GW58_DENCH|nr:hypothetical protein IEQ34_010885 [Dendrobium chrysotoxum]
MESVATITVDKLNMEILPFIRMYQSGRIERLYQSKTVPASVDPRTGVSSRDITINPSARLSARLYLPPTAIISRPAPKKLPVIVYYHGGGFCTFSASSSHYHSYLNSLVAEADVIAVSVDYRLAPEHPLPTAYEDSWEALLWVTEHAYDHSFGLDRRFAEFGDFSKIFLVGDSAGANIVHNMGIRLAENGMEVEGLALMHPYFWGKERMGMRNSKAGPSMFKTEDFDALWPFVCPDTFGLDDPRVNPLAEGAPSLAALGSRRVLVSVAERDLLRERGRSYYERLRASGWGKEAVFFETKGKDHVFHVFQRPDEKAAELMRHLVSFLKEESIQGRYSLLMDFGDLASDLLEPNDAEEGLDLRRSTGSSGNLGRSIKPSYRSTSNIREIDLPDDATQDLCSIADRMIVASYDRESNSSYNPHISFEPTEFLPPSFDQTTGVESKDIAINPSTDLSARLYPPSSTTEMDHKLPVVSFYHDGGFCIHRTASAHYLNHLTAKDKIFTVSIDYCLAPEHPIPAAYDDSWEALRWVAQLQHSEPWLSKFGDLDKIFLAGDSAREHNA